MRPSLARRKDNSGSLSFFQLGIELLENPYFPSNEISLSDPRPDKKRYIPTNNTPKELPAPGLPFSFVFRAEPGKEDVILKIASAYEAASKRRVSPPSFPPLSGSTSQQRTAAR